MPIEGRIGEVLYAGVKGEFVGKTGPSRWEEFKPNGVEVIGNTVEAESPFSKIDVVLTRLVTESVKADLGGYICK